MSDLLGVFSHRPDIDAMRFAANHQSLSGQLNTSRRVYRHGERSLWLVAEQGKLLSDGDGCLAMEGCCPGFYRELHNLRRFVECGTQSSVSDGHYSIASFNRNANTLTLLRGLSGGERLYFVRTSDCVIFASSIRPLI